MDEVTPTTTATIPTWTADIDALMASILANPEGGPPETTNQGELFAYYLAKSILRTERTHKIRFLNPHITTLAIIVLGCLFLSWPKRTNKSRLTDLLAITCCLALLYPQQIHLSLLAFNLSLFYLSWTLIPGPYSGKTPPNLPDWPTLLASLPQKPHSTARKQNPQEGNPPSPTNPSSPSPQEAEEEEEACMICWTSPSPSLPLLQLPCTHQACKPCLNLLFPPPPPPPTTNSSSNNPLTSPPPIIPTNPTPTTSSQSSPLYTCPLCHRPLATNPLTQKIFRLQKLRVALYPLATSLYLLAITYRFRRAEYWDSFWPIPFLFLSVLVPLTWFARRVRRDGGRWWLEGEDFPTSGGGRGGGLGVREGESTMEGKGKVPSWKSSVANLVVIASLVAGKLAEVGLLD
ncbi:hypothetical protein NU219Hw_g6018t1 [Hortaea werneckii]